MGRAWIRPGCLEYPDDGLETPIDDHDAAISLYRRICRALELSSFA
jgi:hypothetical protein